jgi:hypothetical protein
LTQQQDKCAASSVLQGIKPLALTYHEVCHVTLIEISYLTKKVSANSTMCASVVANPADEGCRMRSMHQQWWRWHRTATPDLGGQISTLTVGCQFEGYFGAQSPKLS